jgi:hypothetical protein
VTTSMVAPAPEVKIVVEGRHGPVLRWLIAAAAGVAAVALLWPRASSGLTGTTDILGYPTFADFDYTQLFRSYRVGMYVGPIVIVTVYALLAWRGPLRRPARPERSTVPVSDGLSASDPALGPDAAPTPPEGAVTPVGVGLTALGVALRLLLPAAVLVLAISSPSTTTGLTGAGFVAGTCYLAGVLALAAGLATLRSDPWSWPVARDTLAVVNGVAGSVAALLGLWLVARHTAVRVIADDRLTPWRWLPGWWVVVVGAVAVLGWVVWRRRGGTSAAAVEYRLLSVIVGSVLVFLITAALSGMLGYFQGFDDAQDLAGSNLLAQGYFPWRDLTFIHGLWADVLRGSFGTAVFENSRWGELAGDTVLVNPLCWVSLYLFTVWFARRNRLFVVGFVLLVFGSHLGALSWRFIAIPVVLVLFGETLRRHSFRWTAAFTFVLFAQAILVPETAYLVAACTVALVLCDFVHRSPGDGWPRSFRRTIWFTLTGAVLVVGFAIFLVAVRSLGQFIDYYRVFGPGHDASGAIPASRVDDVGNWVKFGTALGLVLLTAWTAIARFRSRRSWSSRDWVMLAYAGFVALYGEKPLGRLDGPHIAQFISVALPLAVMWTAWAVDAGDGLVRRWWHRSSGRPLLPMLRAVTTIGVILALVAVPSLDARVQALPDRLHASVTHKETLPRLGYAARNAVPPDLVPDLRVVLDTYAGRSGAVFDFSNSPGYFYYLLDRHPGTRYYHVSMAVPPFAQNQLVADLARSRPPVVIFDTTTIGLAGWDGLHNSVRHYIVSQYLLDHWVPAVRTHGVLVMVRRDLVPTLPKLPPLAAPPQTTDLYFSGTSACNWGDTPNFFRPRPGGRTLDLSVAAEQAQNLVSVTGWAVNPATGEPVSLVALLRGREIVATTRPSRARIDVEKTVGRPALNSGFELGAVAATGHPLLPLALTADHVLHPIGDQPLPRGTPSSVRLPDGTTASIVAQPVSGGLDKVEREKLRLSTVTVPDGTDLANYSLATFAAGARQNLGQGSFWIADNPTDEIHRITANALDRAGPALSIRVGSCLQWHGFTGRTLYLQQPQGNPITDVRLSGLS